MKRLQLSEKIIKCSFYNSVKMIEYFSDTKKLVEKEAILDNMAEGTLGKEISNCLKENQLSLVPNYESHDLKHSLLDYKMTPLDEIRMQAFMLGNGNWSIPSIGIFIFGAILLPSKWKAFIEDFCNGQRTIPIKDWAIEKYADRQIDELRNTIYNQPEEYLITMKNSILKTISQYGSFAAIASGLICMLYCLPFLYSANSVDVIGAGFPFIAGAILLIGGLINLSILTNKSSSTQNSELKIQH